MRALNISPGLVLVLCIGAHQTASAQIWVDGVISDSDCGVNHAAAKAKLGDKHMPDSECVLRCVKEQHAQYVFVSKKQTYPIANQDAAGLEESAGHSATITGHLNGGVITIANVIWRGVRTTRFFAGSLDRLSQQSLTIHQPDGVSIDAAVPHADTIAAAYHLGDQVVITCESLSPPTLDSSQGRYQYQELTSIRLLRLGTVEEARQIIAAHRAGIASSNLLWRSLENLSPEIRPPLPQAATTADQDALEQARTVNLDNLKKMRDFVADEVAKTYTSPRAVNPPAWNLQYTVESEITTKRGTERRTNVRKDGKAWTEPLLPPYIAAAAFDTNVLQIFSRSCPNTFEFAGRRVLRGKPVVAYRVRSPAGGCFANQARYETYRPAIQGQILVEDPGGRLIQFEYEASQFPDEFFLSYWTLEATWDDVKIGDSMYLLPVGADLAAVDSTIRSQVMRVTREYKNHRHFEASSNMTFP